jgi:hypothetical protein
LYRSAACSALNWEPDEEGINGMVITKTLPSEAANVLEKGVRKITPSIMTWSQYAEAAVNYIQQASTALQMPACTSAHDNIHVMCAVNLQGHLVGGSYSLPVGKPCSQPGLSLHAAKHFFFSRSVTEYM